MIKINYHFLIFLIIITLFFADINLSQTQTKNNNDKVIELDKCGFPIDDSNEILYLSPEYMGYSYDSLLADLELWRMSEYVKIDSIGLSVQGRPLWQLTISDDPNNLEGKRTIHIHARTHPQETEGFYVTDEMIKILLSESEFAQTARANCVFYIIPMFNPDGVVLGYPRKNANNVDLESNWNTFPHQPEVAALKAQFTQLMASPNPIEVMLNMHSSSLCARYFVYHHENGTSSNYAQLEQGFINGVRSYFPGGIEPYTYFVSWASGTALQYPESWFWVNHGESVMALTYEDMYQCSQTGKFDSTASAILHGVMDYMGISVVPVELYSFTAQAQDQKIILKWTTATELNNNGFEIQRRFAESDFATIGFVRGKGTTTNKTEYSYIDKDLTDGKYYYRLKQIDFNGTYEYSSVIEVDVRSLDNYTLEQNYPNPFNPSTIISFTIPNVTLSASSRAESRDEGSRVQLRVYDILGNEVVTLVDEYKSAGMYNVEFTMHNLASGIYFYKLQAGDYVESRKMVLLK
ncbi:MAG TPA: hypothetical protein DHV28_00235 [Ignavibacteriales bacterium]|nr:hypothetical protein [Ignavibacteriales bacterium]